MSNSINLNSPAALIAALPGSFGFVPTDSGVFVALKATGEIVFNARQDFEAMTSTADHITDVAREHGAVKMLLVAITPNEADAASAMDQVAAITESKGIEVGIKLHTSSCEFGNLWTDVDTGRTGLTEDYRSSAVAAAQAVQGNAISTDRANLYAHFALTDPVDPDSVTVTSSDYLDIARHLYATVNINSDPSPELAAQIGRVISDNITVRDALIIVGAFDPAGAAGVFTKIAGALRGQYRAEVLALVGAFCAMNGKGVLAGIAYDEAADCATTHIPALLTMIDQAVHAGISPTQLTDVLVQSPDYARNILGGDHTTT